MWSRKLSQGRKEGKTITEEKHSEAAIMQVNKMQNMQSNNNIQ